MVPGRSLLVLNDHQVEEAADVATLVKICDATVVAASRDEITAPPRHAVDFGIGQLIFTTGGSDQAVDSRAYDIFPKATRGTQGSEVCEPVAEVRSFPALDVTAVVGFRVG